MLRFVTRPEALRGWLSDEHMARTGEALEEARVIDAVAQVLALGDGQALRAFLNLPQVQRA